MEIHYFTCADSVSIAKTYAGVIKEIGKTNLVKNYVVPCDRFTPYKALKNILYVYKHRTKDGVNHITGAIHFCMLGLIGVKSVLTVHDLGFYTEAQHSRLKRIYLFLFQIYIPFLLADKIIAISDSTKDEIIRIVPSVAPKVVRVNHYGINEFPFTPKPKINKEKPVLLQIGTRKNKNLETTMRAVKGLNCHLRIIREMSKEQIALAKELGIDYSNACNLTDKQLIEEYQKCDIVCFPSIYEGLGVITLEAQAIGRAVITTNMEPMRSVAGGAAILLDDPYNVEEYQKAIISLLNNDDFRNNIIAKGLKNIEYYKNENCAQQHLNVYKTLQRHEDNRCK